MGRTSFVLFVIAAVFLVSQKLIQPQAVESLASSKIELPPVTPSNLGGQSSAPLSDSPIAEATIVQITATPLNPRSSDIDLPSKTPTIIPTRTLIPPLPTPIPTAEMASTEPRICALQGCVVWTRSFSVTQTMNRWQVWQQFVGTGMMEWNHFVYAVLIYNPQLQVDGFIFKVGHTYLLPNCVAVETH